jgi:hypothetical protein
LNLLFSLYTFVFDPTFQLALRSKFEPFNFIIFLFRLPIIVTRKGIDAAFIAPDLVLIRVLFILIVMHLLFGDLYHFDDFCLLLLNSNYSLLPRFVHFTIENSGLNFLNYTLRELFYLNLRGTQREKFGFVHLVFYFMVLL